MASSQPVVLVTGASRGLGLAIAQQLLSQGSNVLTLSRSLTPELGSLSEKKHKDDAEILTHQGSVNSEKDTQEGVKKALEKWQRLDGVILNAGVIDFARISDVTPSSFAEQIQTNLSSLVVTLHYTLPHLRKSPTGQGKVVFVSSGASVGNTAGWSAYNAGKAGMNAIARTLASEEPSLAIWAVRPGVVATEMQTQIRSSGKESMDAASYDKFSGMHRDGTLLPPEQPGHVLAALAIRGTRDDPKGADGQGAGAKGGYIDWSSEELKSFRLP
ncbi:Predicted dehydrogenase [Ceraceosorus bombacis]|uniref:Predicted dehydrogenase n=1 Tax=Ceraceosorus bombacis TaxID=401625 RepID=A0A0P1BS75_9BASI|nr:Predicted dehydrogenase [Ceraceosorus bombacis]